MYTNFITLQAGKKKNKHFKDANISEDLRFCSREYLSKCRKRILTYIPNKGAKKPQNNI